MSSGAAEPSVLRARRRPAVPLHQVRQAWALIDRRERRRLQLIALIGVAIAMLDTLALLLVYALINLMNNQPVSGIAADLVGRSHPGSDHYRLALVLLAITSALFVGRSLLSVFVLWWGAGVANTAQANLISRLLAGHAHAPYLMRLERNSAETLRTLLVSVDQVVTGIVFSSVSLLANLAVAAAVAVGLILSTPVVALAISGYFVLIALGWVRLLRGPLAERGRRGQELALDRYQLIMQGIGAAKELQLRGRALFYANAAGAKNRGMNAVMRFASVMNASLRYMLETALVLGAVLVVGVAGLTGGRETVLPAVGLVLAGAFRLLPALNQVLFLSNQVQFNGPAVAIVEQELRTFGAFAPLEQESSPTAVTPLHLADELRVDNVTFRYPTRDEPALRAVSLTVSRGESIGIVGPTGQGKSTLLDVVTGMLEPQSGHITIDGVPIAECRDAWQRSIGYVPQDVYLVDDTLRGNIALGWHGDEIDDERVVEVIRLAGLDDVAARLPQGLDTFVGERGVRLSGGQRQRVGLARALYTRPTVLVLDEATSNLDQRTEQRIVDTLAKLRGGMTMIVVTHRLASVRDCDRVFYVEEGRVRVAGTLAEISASVPEFDGRASVRRVAHLR